MKVSNKHQYEKVIFNVSLRAKTIWILCSAKIVALRSFFVDQGQCINQRNTTFTFLRKHYIIVKVVYLPFLQSVITSYILYICSLIIWFILGNVSAQFFWCIGKPAVKHFTSGMILYMGYIFHLWSIYKLLLFNKKYIRITLEWIFWNFIDKLLYVTLPVHIFEL